MFPNLLVSLIMLGFLYAIGSVRLGNGTRWALRATAVPNRWLDRQMAPGGWNGFAIGAVMFVREGASETTITHEERHVLQQMVFGVFQPILYGIFVVVIYLFIRNKHPYYDNPFERDARKSAGQQVDIPKSWWRGDRWIWW